MDLAKSFDIADKEKVVKNIMVNRCRNTAFKRFVSYLENRKQFVKINLVESIEELIDGGLGDYIETTISYIQQ